MTINTPRKQTSHTQLYANNLDWAEELVLDMARRSHGIADEHDLNPEAVLESLATLFAADLVSRGNY